MKKLLALVLALVMTLSLCTISNAAYGDAADVNLDEAVDVMSAVGVFQGDENGKFLPTANLTREAAAKLIAYLDLGETVAEALPAVKVFNDVEASRWSAKYIAYCADAGYLAGDGNGNFLPTADLTGYAFGKMVLCVLGYDATIEGFTGSSWTIKVAKLMESNDIADGVKGSASATLTREQAAQYCLNALQTTMVDYDEKGTSISINGATIATGASKAEDVKDTSADADAIINDDYLQLGEELYEGDLKLKDNGKDAYGRTADEWTYDGDVVGSYSNDTADYTYVIDSDDYLTLGNLVEEKNLDKKVELTTAEEAYALPYGSVVELYVDSDDDTLDNIVVYYYAVTEITDVDKVEDEDIIADGATYSISTAAFTGDIYDANIEGFDAATFVEDAYVMYPVVVNVKTGAKAAASTEGDFDEIDDTIYVDVTVVTAKEGSLTNYKTTDVVEKYVTMDGTKYYIAANAVTEDAFAANDDTYGLFVDPNGFVVYSKLVEEASATIDEVYYVASNWHEEKLVSGTKTDKFYAQLVALDGTVTEVELEQYTFATSTAKGAATSTTVNNQYAGMLVTISDKKIVVDSSTVCKASNEKYNFTKWTNDDFDIYYSTSSIAALTKTDSRLTFAYDTLNGTASASSKVVRLNSATKYVFIEASGSDLDVDVYTGAIAYKNGSTKAYVITEEDSAIAQYVIITTTDSDQAATYSEDVVYIKGNDNVKGNGFYSQTVYLKDGSKETWNIDDAETIYEYYFVSYDTNTDDYYVIDKAEAMDLTELDSGVWDDEEGVVYGTIASIDEVDGKYYVAVTASTKMGASAGYTVYDLDATDASFADLHSTTTAGNYKYSISDLDKLETLFNSSTAKFTSVEVALNVSEDGVVSFFVIDADGTTNYAY